MVHWTFAFTWCIILHLVVQSSSIQIDKSIVDKLSKYDQQLFKSFNNKTMHLNGDEHINALLENNRNWVRSKNEEDPEFFQKLGDSLRHDEVCNSSLILCITSITGKPQTPRFLYFGCADSRVPATEILGLG